MSYNIHTLTIYNNEGEDITKELDEDSQGLIDSGYFPGSYNETYEPKLIELSHKYGKIVEKGSGDYGEILRVIKKGVEKDMVIEEDDPQFKSFIKNL